MEIAEFTNTFLPGLLNLYVEGQMPTHALFDIDLWRKLFPDTPATTPEQIRWKQITFTCHPLQDGTLLFTYILPEPLVAGRPKFAAFRLERTDSDDKRIAYYVMRKPARYDDPWDILSRSFSSGTKDNELSFLCKVDGADSLRNFVLTVQQKDFQEHFQSKSLLGRVRGVLGILTGTQKSSQN